MNIRAINFKLILGVVAALWVFLLTPLTASAEPGCRNGAGALGNAYVRLNPLYALYYGSLESYVAENRQHFTAGSDAVRCARALSQATLAGAIQAYDPEDLRRQQELNTRFQSMGMNPGAPQASPATQFYMMGLTFARLARVLPPAAAGNYQPLHTPTTELEQQQIFAGQLLQSMMDRATLESIRPLIEQSAQLEFKIITDMAAGLAR